ncbi:MAG: IS1380 family transposase [Gammaproteobacteria bacterium]|nr:IS1380 family transposase [Gammaproteobacteria bacterium]
MNNDSTRQSVLFNDLFPQRLVARFDQRRGSSDGGAILLKAADQRLGLSERLAACMTDRRQDGKVSHSLHELLSQRLYAIACGHADGNDAARLAWDPIHQLLAGAADGAVLASQPTLSRFENAVDVASLYRMSVALAECVIARHRRRLGRRRVKQLTIDLDPTDDPTHGGQQLTFFNGHYDTWCYLPVAGFVTFNQEPEQYLLAYVLRPGNAPTKQGAIGILSRLLERLRAAFPRAQILVRLDGGFACPELFAFLEDARVDYVVAMAENQVLTRRASRLLGTARRRSRETGETAHVFGECRYAARSWDCQRRVIIKAEVVRLPGREPKDNARFVVTNLKRSPRHLYKQVYCARGDIENRIKELHYGLQIDRTSCTRFLANQLRVLITAAAYVLMQELRLRAARTSCARAQVNTLRERLLKLGVWIETSVRRIVLHLPRYAPYRNEWQQIARTLGAVPT